MEIILEMIVRWRICLAAFVAMLLGLVVQAAILSFAGSFVIVMICVGIGAGLLWEASASKSKGK